MLSSPVPLIAGHDISRFACGEPTLDAWLQHRAIKNETAGASRTYVVLDDNRVVGYYSLAVGSIEHTFVPAKVKRNMPDPIPAMILGRLAVDQQYAGNHIGSGLLRDALKRTYLAADIAGIRVLMVHALHERAAWFYYHRGFWPSPFNPLLLFRLLDPETASRVSR